MANTVNRKLREILKNSASRDNSGKVSVRFRGGRHKRFYRQIDWRRDKFDIEGEVIGIEYDPNRSTNICLVKYADGENRYILHPSGLNIGDKIVSSDTSPVKSGCAMLLRNIPIGVEIHAVELIPGKGAQIIRSAGGSGVIIGKDENFAHIKFPSGEIRKVDLNARATIGKLDNEDRMHQVLGKAGARRHLGKKPRVRGVAMNPRSHPHGGGEGRSGEGMHPKTPWGKVAHGLKTRKKQPSDKLIIKRRNK